MEPGLTLPRRSCAPDPLQGIGPNHWDTWRDSPCEEALVASPLWLTHAGHVLPVRVCVCMCVWGRGWGLETESETERGTFQKHKKGANQKLIAQAEQKQAEHTCFTDTVKGLCYHTTADASSSSSDSSLTFTVGQTWKEQSGVAVPAVVMSHVNIQVWRSF